MTNFDILIEEGSFSMCSLWMIECLGRAGAYDPVLLARGVAMLEDFIGQSIVSFPSASDRVS